MCRQQTHGLALVNSQCQTHQVPNEIDQTLKKLLTWTLQHLESGWNGHKCLDGSPGHHTHHHGREDGDGIACHVHDEEIHGNLFEGTQGDVPAALLHQDPVGLLHAGIRHLLVQVTDWVEWVSLSTAPVTSAPKEPNQIKRLKLRLPKHGFSALSTTERTSDVN